ncbi:MAG: ferredoxin [Oscillospiraceae bacterium]|jgi:ferredoxin|nr:ferredoxin [Oscillospiraceae bacterium]
MNILIKRDVCVGCGMCAGICPEVFIMDIGGKSCVMELSESEVELCEEKIRECADICPVGAIVI